MRALEVLNLIDIGELTFITALERKETRGNIYGLTILLPIRSLKSC
jgi:succinate dehydrogenase/fumarate reductase flavoprotein subunit